MDVSWILVQTFTHIFSETGKKKTLKEVITNQILKVQLQADLVILD